jgi:putative transposase
MNGEQTKFRLLRSAFVRMMDAMPGTAHFYRINRVRLLASSPDLRTTTLIADRVSALWNAANYLSRQRFIAGESVPNNTKLDKLLARHPARLALPSDIAQEVTKKLNEAWRSYFALRKQWSAGTLRDKPGLPRYRKNKDGSRPADFIPLKTARSYAIDTHAFSMVLPADLRPRPGIRLVIPHRGLMKHKGVLGRAELRFDTARRRWHASIAVAVKRTADRPSTRAAAIDLGVRILASLSIEDDPTALHFAGREVLKDWDYWGRRIADCQQALARTGRKSSQRLIRLHAIRRARLEHAWEAIAARIVATLRRRKVGHVFLGWPKEIRRERTYGGPWAGRIHNFWSFERALRILEKHLARARIAATRVGERGTSSHCPSCGSDEVVRHPRWRLACRACGFACHADQAGSRNILTFNRPGATFAGPIHIPGDHGHRDGVEATPRTQTAQWNHHRWTARSVNRALQALPVAA